MASTLKATNINNADSNPGSTDKDKDKPAQVSSQGPSQVNYPSTSKGNNPYNT